MMPVADRAPASSRPVAAILGAVSASHFLNDLMQAVLPAIYPLLKTGYGLDFAAVGLLTFAFQITASLLQPLVGLYTDRHPLPWSLPLGMVFTFCGLLLLSRAPDYAFLLLAASLIGVGSSIFHPESSRVARLASGGRHGLAQSVFQVGGNAGQALGPLLVALIVLPGGQSRVAWFAIAAVMAMGILTAVGRWYAHHLGAKSSRRAAPTAIPLPRRKTVRALVVLLALVFSKFFYLASISSYLIFYLVARFDLGVRAAQIHLFLFLGAVAAGTVIGGPIGDRIGRKRVIWVSIAGVLPFSLLLPHVGLAWTAPISVLIGLIIASAQPAIVVYAQELLPGRTGLVSGLFFGLAFGMGGLGAALLGVLADATSIGFVYQVCAFLPAIGLLAAFLPEMRDATPEGSAPRGGGTRGAEPASAGRG